MSASSNSSDSSNDINYESDNNIKSSTKTSKINQENCNYILSENSVLDCYLRSVNKMWWVINWLLWIKMKN